MNNLYNQEDVKGILERLENLEPSAKREWGKMDVAQMLAHLNIAIETAMGLNFPKRVFLGRIIGNMIKKKFLNDQPMDKNSPTDKNYIFLDNKDFAIEKAKAIKNVEVFFANGPEKCTQHPHSFFGNLTAEEWAVLQWKHFDHHLRQFGA